MKVPLSIVFVFSLNSLFAQQKQVISVKEIPTSVQGNLMKAFPDLNTTTAMRNAVKWEKDRGGYEASFSYKGSQMSASFDGSGLMKETEAVLTKENVPPAIFGTIRSKFSKEKFTEFSKITYPDGTVNFEAVNHHTAYLFTTDGKFIRKQND